MMIDRPRTEITLQASARWHVEGAAAERVRATAERALASLPGDRPQALQLHVTPGAPLHRGLGGGTQLSMAVAAGVRALVGASPGDAATLARIAGRGQRSAVGSHGFVHGGLLWELGRRPEDVLANLAARISMPEQWRVLLVTPGAASGLSGQSERDAFATLPPVPEAATQRLRGLSENQILPAARAADLDAFGEAVYQYGRLSGEQFAAAQGGPYASAAIAARVAAIRSRGVCGVGQSSWGPTVYAIVGGEAEAATLAADLANEPATAGCTVTVAAPDNRGAAVTCIASTAPDTP